MKKSLGKKVALVTSFALLGLTTVPPESAAARTRNPFNRCLRDLTAVGVSQNNASTACADALIPKELSRCVVTINKHNPRTPEKGAFLSADDMLEACYQVRRPVDLANCFVDVNDSAPQSPEVAKLVLESCRKSLLPGRYSQCVIALNRNPPAELATEPDKLTNWSKEALQTCLDAQDFPADLFPPYLGN